MKYRNQLFNFLLGSIKHILKTYCKIYRGETHQRLKHAIMEAHSRSPKFWRAIQIRTRSGQITKLKHWKKRISTRSVKGLLGTWVCQKMTRSTLKMKKVILLDQATNSSGSNKTKSWQILSTKGLHLIA